MVRKRNLILLLEPDDAVRAALSALLKEHGWRVQGSGGAASLEEKLGQPGLVAVVCESTLPDSGAREVLDLCQQANLPVVFLGHRREIQQAVDLVRSGALDFIEKPFPQERLVSVLAGLENNGAAA